MHGHRGDGATLLKAKFRSQLSALSIVAHWNIPSLRRVHIEWLRQMPSFGSRPRYQRPIKKFGRSYLVWLPPPTVTTRDAVRRAGIDVAVLAHAFIYSLLIIRNFASLSAVEAAFIFVSNCII